MTDNEIIKAFGICNSCVEGSCKNCPCYNHEGLCIVAKNEVDLEREVFDLLARQKAEIERLKLITTNKPYCVRIGTADIYTENHEEYEKLLARISAEAIKEFAERLKEESFTICHHKIVLSSDIDNLVKEMVGEGNV